MFLRAVIICLLTSPLAYATSGWDDYTARYGNIRIQGTSPGGCSVVLREGDQQRTLLVAKADPGNYDAPLIAQNSTHLFLSFRIQHDRPSSVDCYAVSLVDHTVVGPVSAARMEQLLDTSLGNLQWEYPSFLSVWPPLIFPGVVASLLLLVLNGGVKFIFQGARRAVQSRSVSFLVRGAYPADCVESHRS